jgi:3-deoxy-D-manno-octulosonic-acid transferase
LLQDGLARNRMGEAALAFAGQHRGATARTVELLGRLIPQDLIPSPLRFL